MYTYWTSGQDSPGNLESFQWTATGAAFGYQSWIGGSPGSYGVVTCVAIPYTDSFQYWGNYDCASTNARYICEDT